MRVGLIVEWLDAARGGAETSTLQFIGALSRRDVGIDVFTRSEVAAQGGVAFHRIMGRGRTRAAATADFVRRAMGAAGQQKCDIVHAFLPCAGANIYQPRGGTVAEVIERNVALRKSGVGRFFKRLATSLNARQRMLLRAERDWLSGGEPPLVIAISQYVRRQLRDHYGVADSRIRVVFNGVEVRGDPPERREADRLGIRRMLRMADEEVLAVQVCHNFRLKGVGSAIRALGAMERGARGRLRLVVVGRGASGGWGRLARRCGVADRVTFAGPVGEAWRYYDAADFLVHPSYYDPCSRVVLEGIAHGLPIVGSRHDGACEVLEDGVSGMLVDAGDAWMLASALERMLDAGTRRRLSGGVARLAWAVSMERHADEVCRLYGSWSGQGADEVGAGGNVHASVEMTR